MYGIAIREELTDEWKNRGAKDQIEYLPFSETLLGKLFGPWCDTVLQAVHNLLSIPKKIVIIHGRSNDWRVVVMTVFIWKGITDHQYLRFS